MTAPATGFRRRRAGSVTDLGERLVGLRHDEGIVEFMAAQDAPCGVTWNCRKQRRGPVAEMQAPLCKIGLKPEQPEHCVMGPRGVDQTRTKRHVAAALAVHRARLREGADAVGEARRGGELAGVQFRIAAG